MDDIPIEIELIKRCGIDPFRNYSIGELESIIQGQVKNWRLFSQDSQRSESEKKRFKELISEAEKLCSDKNELDGVFADSKEVFLETFNDELLRKFVIRSDGSCVITQSVLDSSVDTIIDRMGWKVKFSPSMITFDYSVITGDGKNREYGKILRKLGKLDSGYSSVEQWLNSLMNNEKLNVEKTEPLADDSGYEACLLVYKNVKKRFDEKAFKLMPHRQDHEVMIGKVGSVIFNTKEDFDSFRTYLSLSEVYQDVDRNYKMGTLNDIYAILKGIRVNSDIPDVIALLEDYFIEKGYGFSFYELDGDVERCSKCGALYRDDGKIMSCSKCGNHFFVICEKCGSRCPAEDSYCYNCSESLQSYEDRIQELLVEFKGYINSCDFNKAASAIASMERIKEDHPSLRDCKETLSKVKQDYQNRVDNITKLVENRQFNEASSYYSQFKRLYPNDTSLDAIGAEISRAIRTLDDILSRTTTDEHDEYSNYIAASEICSDDSRVRTYFQTHPPKPPAFINVDPSESDVRIDVDGSVLKNGAEIIIVRKIGSIPFDYRDGMQLYCGSSTSFIDTDVKAGVDYYYAAYTIRSQVVSGGIVGERVCILPDPSFEKIDYYPDSIFGIVSFRSDCSNIILEKTEVDRELWTPVKIHISDSSASFTDSDVIAGVTYQYRAIAVYGTHRSVGSVVSKSIRETFPLHLTVERSGNLYYAKEKNQYPFEVLLSKEYIDSTRGYLPCDQLPDSMNGCNQNIDSNCNHIFTVKEGFSGFVYASRKVDNFIILSNPVEISSLCEVKDLTHMLDGSKCTLIFTMPEEAIGVTVLWNDSIYPEGLRDPRSNRRDVNRNAHVVNGNTVEIQLSGKEAFFKIITLYPKNRTSEGFQYHITVKKPFISYSVSSRKTGFLSKKSHVSIVFRSDVDGLIIDDLVVAIGNNMPPRGLDEAIDTIDVPSLSFDSGVEEFSFDIMASSVPYIRVLSKNVGSIQRYGLRFER